MTDLHITARQFKALVSPVLPCAGTDDMLPVLNSVRIEAHGEWLVASATDRFRAGFRRLRHPDGKSWPKWNATLPLSTVRSVMAFKPSRKDTDPELVLAVLPDNRMRVAASGALLDMLAAEVTYPLRDGQFPDLRAVVRDSLAVEPDAPHSGFNWEYLAAFKAAVTSGPGLQIRVHPNKAAVITDGEDFIGILMPRRVHEGATDFRVGEGWDTLLAEPKKPARKRAAKKPAAKRATAGSGAA